MEATAGERDADEEGDDHDSQVSRERQPHHRRDLSTTTTNPVTSASLFSLAGNISEGIGIRERRIFSLENISSIVKVERHLCK